MLFRRHKQKKKIKFSHNGQRYILKGGEGLEDRILTITPIPLIKGTRTDGFFNDHTPRPCRAHVDFKVLTKKYGRFSTIEVPEEYQRTGVGRAMVLAMFYYFPDVVFHNTSLNTKSGPFFQSIQKEYPDHLAPITDHQIFDTEPY